jgi:N-acyl homoserine lactone hydrolase
MQLATLQPGDIPVPAYLVQMESGKNILIDSGFPESFINKSVELPGVTTVELSNENYIVSRLKSLGLSPEDIETVVCTHLDADHAGAHREFTNAEFVVQREHYRHALESQHPRFTALRGEWNHPALNYRLVDGDTELVPGIELIETSGHVPGHQAVLIRLLETGAILLAIDAIPHSSMLDADSRIVMPIDMDEAGTRASTRRLNEIARRENVKLIVYGHNSEQWKTLKHAPEFYS